MENTSLPPSAFRDKADNGGADGYNGTGQPDTMGITHQNKMEMVQSSGELYKNHMNGLPHTTRSPSATGSRTSMRNESPAALEASTGNCATTTLSSNGPCDTVSPQSLPISLVIDHNSSDFKLPSRGPLSRTAKTSITTTVGYHPEIETMSLCQDRQQQLPQGQANPSTTMATTNHSVLETKSSSPHREQLPPPPSHLDNGTTSTRSRTAHPTATTNTTPMKSPSSTPSSPTSDSVHVGSVHEHACMLLAYMQSACIEVVSIIQACNLVASMEPHAIEEACRQLASMQPSSMQQASMQPSSMEQASMQPFSMQNQNTSRLEEEEDRLRITLMENDALKAEIKIVSKEMEMLMDCLYHLHGIKYTPKGIPFSSIQQIC